MAVVRVGVGHRAQICHVAVFPTGRICLGCATTAFGETTVTHLAPVGEHLVGGLLHGISGIGVDNACEPLIALAMVVGANVIESVVAMILPGYNGVCFGRIG